MAREIQQFRKLYEARGVKGNGHMIPVLPNPRTYGRIQDDVAMILSHHRKSPLHHPIQKGVRVAHADEYTDTLRETIELARAKNRPKPEEYPKNIAQMMYAINHNISLDSRKEAEFADIPDDVEMTQTLTREEVMFRMVTRLSEGRSYNAKELASVVDNYPIGLFVKSSDSKIVTEGALVNAHEDDIKKIISYVLPRFVNSNHFEQLNNAEVHFTDNVEDFYSDGAPKFIPNSRSRVYSLTTDKSGKNHITFLLRHNIKENYTDALELMSFMGFIETARAFGKKHEKKEVGMLVDGLKNGSGIQLSKSNKGLAKPWEKVNDNPETVPAVMQDVVDKIDVELKRLNIKSPQHVMFGNDFSVPLLIGTGLITPEEFAHIKKVADEEAILTETPNKVIDEAEIFGLKVHDQEILRQFSMLQYLNRYSGNDETMKHLKGIFESEIATVRKRIINPTYTALGTYIDIIDFSGLNEEIIKHIDNEEIKEIVNGLKEVSFSYYSLPYPLGDSIHGITRAFKKKLGVENFGFFGKVGAVPVEGSKINRGRVVLPKATAAMHIQRNQRRPDGKTEGIHPFPNILLPEDTVIISSADRKDTVLTVNGLTLQVPRDDIPTAKILINENDGDTGYVDLLLDMEADYFNEACKVLGIIPAAIYYVSDLTLEKTPDPYAKPEDKNHDHTIVNALGAQGTLAALVTPFTILKKWLKDYRAGIIRKAVKEEGMGM